MQLMLPSVATLGDHMASLSWLLWNQIMLFEELSRGDTCRRICRRIQSLLWEERLLQEGVVLMRWFFEELQGEY